MKLVPIVSLSAATRQRRTTKPPGFVVSCSALVVAAALVAVPFSNNYDGLLFVTVVKADICKSENSVPCYDYENLEGDNVQSFGVNGTYYCIDDGCDVDLLPSWAQLLPSPLDNNRFPLGKNDDNNETTAEATTDTNNLLQNLIPGRNNQSAVPSEDDTSSNNQPGGLLPNISRPGQSETTAKELCGVTLEGIKKCEVSSSPTPSSSSGASAVSSPWALVPCTITTAATAALFVLALTE